MPLKRAHSNLVGAATWTIFAAAVASSPPAQGQDKDACASAAEEGQKLRDTKKLRAARASLVSCAQEACPAIVRDDCKRWLAEVEAKLPTVVLKARSPDGKDLVEVRVSVGGEELTRRLDGTARPVDPGVHDFIFEAAGAPPITERVVIAEGDKDRAISIVVGAATGADERPAPETPPKRASIGPWVLLGVGLAGGAAFAVLQVLAHGEIDDLEAPGACGASKTCSDDDLDPIRTKLVASGVSLGVGAAALVGAGVWWLVDRPSSSQTKSAGAASSFQTKSAGAASSSQTKSARGDQRRWTLLARPDPSRPWVGAAARW